MMTLDTEISEATANKSISSMLLQPNAVRQTLIRQMRQHLGRAGDCYNIGARPTVEQRADFFQLIDAWRQRTIGPVPNTYATYTHEQRFLFRENQPAMLNQQDERRFHVRLGLEYCYIRTGGTTIHYDRYSLEAIARSKGKTLESDL